MDTSQASKVSESNILYILTGKFDNKYGPTIASQYPKCIPGFAQKEAQNTIQLASLMIPNNIEHRAAAGADYNMFKLYFNKNNSSYELLPPINERIEDASKEPSQISFINIVRAQSDKNDSRGAKIRSIALGTTLSNVEIMKPILLKALEDMMQQGDDDNEKLVQNCFGVLNSVDLSTVREILEDQSLQQMLQAVIDKDSINNALDDSTESASRVRKMLKLTPLDKYGNRIMLDKGRVRVHFDQYAADSQFNYLTKDPLLIDLVACLPMRANSCGHPVLTFLQKLIPLLEKMPSTNYSFKIIINSDKFSKERLCRFVIALSGLIGCFHHSASSGSPCAISLPYIEVSMINTIKEYFGKHYKSLRFCVMGTANPIFKHHTDLWDFYYNLDDETMLVSNEQSDSQRNSLWDPQLIKKFLHMNINEMAPFQSQDHIRIGLLAKFLSIIKEENPNSSEALGALKKVNVIQLMHLNNILGFSHGRDFYLLDSYLIGYKDFVRFDEFFTPESQQYIRWFTTLDFIIDCLFRSDQNLSERQQDLGSLHDILTDILQKIGTSTSNLEAFLANGLNYPFLRSSVSGNLLRKDFASINVQKEIHENWKKGKSWLHIVDGENIDDGVIKYFVRDRSLVLLSLPLLLNSHIRRPKQSKTKNLDTNLSTSALPVSTTAANLHSDYEGRRPRSMSLKWMLNLANPRSRDSILETVSLRSGSDASVYSFASAKSYPSTNGSGSSSSMSSASSSMSSASARVSFKFLRGETEKIKKLAFAILSKIEEHPIGEILIKNSFNSFLQLVYEGSKVEFVRNLEDTTRIKTKKDSL